MIKFKFFGIQIKIFFLFVCLLCFVLISYGEKILISCGVSAIFHEICHLMCLCFFKCRVVAIEFRLGGIVIVSDDLTTTTTQKIVVLFAGCLGNLFLFVICSFLQLNFLALTNLCFMIFNMLPNEKLDGGQIIEIIFQKIFGFVDGTQIFRVFSTVISVFLLALSLLFYLSFHNFTLLIFAIMLMFPK